MKNPRNLTVEMAGGRQLPRDWQHRAAQRAALADADYQQRISEGWRQPIGRTEPSLTRSAMLSQQHTDRADSRFDSEMRLVYEDDIWETWQDSHGTTIRRRRK
jgi:hypothetical protein